MSILAGYSIYKEVRISYNYCGLKGIYNDEYCQAVMNKKVSNDKNIS